ncbi:hypothetical protein KFE25_009440 [Diacronema lutheri]|uniref:Uncharacterized protein n=1 Tax=Diacronema lutheri TaxID=2081491 RepID=A0A8J5Y587_DIALT|nr:hypothetical protein KFE25_009440 [Diacronema lutheri]
MAKGKRKADEMTEGEEFVPAEGTGADDEDTLVEEERLAAADGDAGHAREIASLEAEADMPIEEVLRRMQEQGGEEGADDEEEEEEEEEEGEDDDEDEDEENSGEEDGEEEEGDEEDGDDDDEGEGEGEEADTGPAKRRKKA